MNPINDCYYLNKKIKELGLVRLTWGNASVLDGDHIYIKASGIDVDNCLSEDSFCKICLKTGENLSSKNPSVDLNTHLEIYKGFSGVGAVIHTHSKFATSFAQAGIEIPCLGTTHADYFGGDVPVIPYLENVNDYESDTGKSIVNFYHNMNINHMDINACLISGHGAFIWDETPEKCLESTLVLELIAEMTYNSLMLGAKEKLPTHILDKHYKRKHGDTKYYGQ